MSFITQNYSIYDSLGIVRILAFLGGILLAILFGLLATTANPIFIALGIGLLLGGMLLTKPAWIIWVVLVLGMLVAGVISIWVDELASKAKWGVSLLGFLLMLIALLRVISVPDTVRGTPAFVWLVLVFILYTVLNSIAHLSSAYEIFGGFKRCFQVAGVMFALAWLGFTEKQVRRWQVFFIVVAIVQLPWAIYELVKLVPIRESVADAYPGMVPIDVVAGTFGASMFGGGSSGQMAIFLIVVLAFLIARWREKLLGFGKFLFLLSFTLLPLFMGQTRVVVILLPIMFLTLYRREFITRPHVALGVLALGTVLTIVVGYFYLSSSAVSIEHELINTLKYNIHEAGYGNNVLNRTTALTFWLERQGLHDPISIVFGNGLGAAHSATNGYISRQYPGYGIDLTALSSLLWEEGLFGTVLFLGTFVLVWRTAGHLQRGTVLSWMRADAAAIQSAISLFSVELVYGPALLEDLTFQIFFFTLLGYTALLYRYHTTSLALKIEPNIRYSHIDKNLKGGKYA